MSEKKEDSKQEQVKSLWQIEKESWYDKLDITVKQLDTIIGLAIAGLVVVFILIALDAIGVI